jgi:serine/threonine protein kinase
MAWDELNLPKSLPPHPNVVPFDRVVLEDVESRVIGFTTKYIPGGILDNSKLPFRFEWIQQLTQLVDFLNLDLGIMHQDIAPRNLLIDPETQNILLFDFD